MKTNKNIRYPLAIMTILMVFTCEDFTEVELPQTQLIGTTVFKDEATATAALSDVYARLRENGIVSGNINGLSMLMGLYTDELSYFGSASLPLDNFYNHTVLPTNDYVSSLWSNSYSQIYALNAILEGLENSNDLTAAFKDSLKGETVFIRALIHFYLVNLFGDVPYVKTTNYQLNAQISRTPINKVYDHIISDLETANELLTYDHLAQNRVKINKATVQSLFARIYAYRNQWSLAETFATAVIQQSSQYSIETDIDAVFLKDAPSTIWQLHSGVAGANTLEGRFFIYTSGPPAIAALSNNLLDAFDNNDLRKQHWINTISSGGSTWHYPYKYKQNGNTGNSLEYSIIFRLEELYLIRAEARANLLNISGAQQDLNTIRNRAGLANTTATTQQTLLEAILKERQLEFFTELGHRWFDIKRNGTTQEIIEPIKPSWQNKDLLLPIPETELFLNINLQPQNQGY